MWGAWSSSIAETLSSNVRELLIREDNRHGFRSLSARCSGLKRRVTAQGLRDVTSNPAIFDKAISSGEDYDAQIHQLVREGCEIYEIYERLVITDIQDACDVLRPVYDASDGKDGFVSLEVSPHLLHDTAGTMAETRRLWNAVARSNVDHAHIRGSQTGAGPLALGWRAVLPAHRQQTAAQTHAGLDAFQTHATCDVSR